MGTEVRFGKQIKNNRLFVLLAFCIFNIYFGSVSLEAATFRTKNFTVTARTPEFAQQVGETAEQCRHDLAIFWLGAPLRAWSAPCPISVRAGEHLGAGGETSFTFAKGEVYGWQMKVQGSKERILDSVVPHEVSHTIFASYFREPVPRWIDEGAATFVEADVERNNYRNMLVDFLKNNRGIPFNDMVSFTEYPKDQMPFYSQGFSVCEYMILVGGPRRFVEFARTGITSKDWSQAVRQYYGYENLGDLQVRWQGWISSWYLAGMPAELPNVEKLAEMNIASPAFSNENIYLADNRSSNGQTGSAAEPGKSLVPIVRGNSKTVPSVASWIASIPRAFIASEPKNNTSVNNIKHASSDPSSVTSVPLQNHHPSVGTGSPSEPEISFNAGVGSALPLSESKNELAFNNTAGTPDPVNLSSANTSSSLNYRGSYGKSLKEEPGTPNRSRSGRTIPLPL